MDVFFKLYMTMIFLLFMTWGFCAIMGINNVNNPKGDRYMFWGMVSMSIGCVMMFFLIIYGIWFHT